MKSIAISGMTASQSSEKSFYRSASFASTLYEVLKENNVSVHFIEPSVFLKKSDFKQYDAILIGVAPILSLAANKAYGALHMINILKNDDRLRLFIDAPEPSKIHTSLRAIDRNSDDIVKPFYASRKHYSDVTGNAKVMDSVLGGAKALLSQWDYVTLYPSTPFIDNTNVEKDLFGEVKNVALGLQIDSSLIKRITSHFVTTRNDFWVVDNRKAKWFKTLEKSLANPIVDMKKNKGTTDSDVYDLVADSSGAIISMSNDGMLWWNYRIAQALNSETPVFSDWRTTSVIGDSWSLLPSKVEDMDYVDIYELAVTQRKQYMSALTTAQETLQTLKNGLGL
jgi:hypothetical protein